MAVNKNFVVKNGLEVNTSLIVADTTLNTVGIATTIPRYTLHVFEGSGIGATDVYVTGFSTVATEFNVGTSGTVFTALGVGGSVGVGTALPAYLLDIRSPVSSGQTALYVQGDMHVTGDINLDDISLDQIYVAGLSTFVGFSTFHDSVGINSHLTVLGISTFNGYVIGTSGLSMTGAGITASSLNVTGVTTLGSNLDVNSFADISGNTNIGGITTIGGALDVNSFTDISGNINVGGLSTLGGYVDINSDTDISGTLNVGGLTTIGGAIDANSFVDISGNINVGGLSTFTGIGTFVNDLYVGGDLYIKENITLDTNLNILGIATVGSLHVTGISTFDGTINGEDDVASIVIGTGLSVRGSSVGVAVTLAGAGGITTTGGDLYVGGDLYISEDVILDTNLSILGIATIGTLYVSGVTTTQHLLVTGVTTLTDRVEASDYVTISKGLQVSGAGSTTTTLNVSGVSTLGGNVDINSFVDISGNTNIGGITTVAGRLDANDYVDIEDGLIVAGVGATTTTLNVSGVSTLGGNVDINSFVDISGNINVGGIATVAGAIDANSFVDISGNVNVGGLSTFVGFSTFSDYVFVQDGLNVGGVTTSTAYTVNGTQVISSGRELQNIASLDATTTATIEAAIANGPNTFTDISVSGLSTFVGFATFQDYVFIQDGLNVTGVVTATSFVGDGSAITGFPAGSVGVASEGTYIGAGATFINFATTTGTNVTVSEPSSGVSTVTVTPGVSLGLAIALGG